MGELQGKNVKEEQKRERGWEGGRERKEEWGEGVGRGEEENEGEGKREGAAIIKRTDHSINSI